LANVPETPQAVRARTLGGVPYQRTGRASRTSERDGLPVPTQRTKEGPTMKLTITAAVGAAVFLALFMGKDDIRRFIRMRAM